MGNDTTGTILLTLMVGLLALAGLIVAVLGRLWWASSRSRRRSRAS